MTAISTVFHVILFTVYKVNRNLLEENPTILTAADEKDFFFLQMVRYMLSIFFIWTKQSKKWEEKNTNKKWKRERILLESYENILPCIFCFKIH